MNSPEIVPNQRPNLIVRVAVTGHRRIDSTREQAIRSSIHAIFEQIVDITGRLASDENSAFSPAPPVLRILSSLAEGADRMVAEEALAFKDRIALNLECPLPAACEEYRNDFKTKDSRDKFSELLSEASVVFALDGQREGEWLRSSDYGRAGHIAVSNCDLLIAIWDGSPGKDGGTGQIASEALRGEIPTLRVDVNNPQSITVWTAYNREQPDWQAFLGASLLSALKPPPSAVDWVERYTGERAGSSTNEATRADLLATHYGDLYRASYRVKYGLSALAVVFAVAGLMPGRQEQWPWPAAELASILGVLSCFLLAWKGEWHERWLDYRLLAEQFRVLRFLQPLGETVPVFHPPRYWGVPTKRHACVRWYFRARLREFNLPNVRVTDEYVQQRRKDVLAAAQGQLKYNANKHRLSEHLQTFLEWAGVLLFFFTAIACILHLGGWGMHALLLGALTATLPAFGAAMEGLQAQEEGKRIASFAGAMAKHMEDVEVRINALPPDADLGAISNIAFELATEMTRETSGWHNLIHGQPPRV